MSSKKNSKLFEKFRQKRHAMIKPYRPDQSKPPRNFGTPPQKIGSRVGKVDKVPQKKPGYIRCSEQWKNGGRITGKPGCTLK